MIGMKILVANDDGIKSKGLYALVKELIKYHEVTVVAPMEQRSASSHSITLFKPINIKEETLENLNCKAYSISGTPADCVRIGLDRLCKDAEVVISGINRGLNAGTDVIYSGTVSAAMEAAIYNIPAIAVSQQVDYSEEEKEEDYFISAIYAAKIIKLAKEKYFKPNVVLNLNVPKIPQEEIKGFRVCKIGKSTYTHRYTKLEDNNYPETYQIDGIMNERTEVDDDVYYIRNGYITLTPLHYDLTNFNILQEVGSVFQEQLLKDI